MSYITPSQRTAQRLITAPTFTDICQRLTESATAGGDYGPGSKYTAAATLPCSFQPRVQRDAQGETMVELSTADLYVALGTTLLPEDRVTITHLLGEALAAPKVYMISGGPLVEHNVLHAELQLLTTS